MIESGETRQTVLVELSGPDRPGITAGLMLLLASADAGVQDVEQIIIRGRLSLSLVVEVPMGKDLIKELLHFGWEQGVDVDFSIVDSVPSARRPGLVVTLVGTTVSPADFAAVAATIAAHGANIDRIVRLARYPVMAYELAVSGDPLEALRNDLLAVADSLPADLAVHREGLGRRAARLVVLDVDSTLIQDEVIELVARHAGTEDEVRAVTERAMAGELDFTESLHARVATLAGLDASVLDDVHEQVRFTPGARTFIRTLHRLGFHTAIVSGGFTAITDKLAAELGIGHAYANTLEVVDGKLTGKVIGDVVDRAGKAAILRRIAEEHGVALDQVVAVGDGANDLDMLNAAGLGVAFNAKPVVQEAADTALNVPYLDAILFVLGVRREEIEAAEAVEADREPSPVD